MDGDGGCKWCGLEKQGRGPIPIYILCAALSTERTGEFGHWNWVVLYVALCSGMSLSIWFLYRTTLQSILLRDYHLPYVSSSLTVYLIVIIQQSIGIVSHVLPLS